jgi:hypothetical protein
MSAITGRLKNGINCKMVGDIEKLVLNATRKSKHSFQAIALFFLNDASLRPNFCSSAAD